MFVSLKPVFHKLTTSQAECFLVLIVLVLQQFSSAFAFKNTNVSRVSGDRQSRRRLQINPASEKTHSDGADVVLPNPSCTSKCLKTRPVSVSLPAGHWGYPLMDAGLLFHFNSVLMSHDSRLRIDFTCADGSSDYLYWLDYKIKAFKWHK